VEYKHKYFDVDLQNVSVPEFAIAPEIALDLLLASDFLDC
jgi:hypothetical protein